MKRPFLTSVYLLHMHRTLTLILVFALAAAAPISASAITNADASFTSSLSTKDVTPRIAGEASGISSLNIEVRNDDDKKVFSKKHIRVSKSGNWSATITKKLKVGDYTVSLLTDTKRNSEVLASTTLTILSKNSKTTKGGTLSVSQVPLLMGGVAQPGTAVPVAYVMIKNTGKTDASIDGITLVETGSAPDSVVTGFTLNDDKGGSRATSTETFKKGSATVPLKADIAAGQTRIFTVKAIISPNKMLYGNAELRINVADVETSAKVSAAFPLIGTVFVLR